MVNKYICVHSHFYQPPRDNPWLEEVEKEDSASPFHDWNERITYECYMPNTAARIMDGGGRITEIANNYEKMSFNSGPTLMIWLEKHDPETHNKIIEADKASARARGGHGNAIAQVFSHSIMPLNTPRDKETQIIWGIKDFERRFGRKPEGIWFAEAAVDNESLALAAKHGIKFTVLAPHQAKRGRPLNAGGEWGDLNGNTDTTYPYLCRPDGNSEIAIFFYDGPLSLSIAFEGALFDGVKMGNRLVSSLKAREDKRGQILTVATDGETYGHHHKFGEMALAYAFSTIEKQKSQVLLTNYGEFLEKHPPDTEVEIVEDSSWSCVHGVERWRADCGCTTGSSEGWNQKWRAPLRKALDNLKEKLDDLFEEKGKKYFKSPWDARNDYVGVVLDKSRESVEAFLARHRASALSQQSVTEALKLLEMQRMSMTMFTSCGWFFADVSGLESVQILKYAERAIEIARDVSSEPIEEEFLELLGGAVSNIAANGTGADIFKKHVQPLRLNPMRVAAHAVIVNALPGRGEETKSVYSFNVSMVEASEETYLQSMVNIGVLELSSATTWETKKLTFCLLHLGAHDYNCFVHPFFETADFVAAKSRILESFKRHSMPDLIHAIEAHFGQAYFTLKDIFEEERGKIMELLLLDSTSQHTATFQQLFEHDRKLMDFMSEINAPMPAEFRMVARYVLGKRLNSLFTDPSARADHKTMVAIFNDAKKWGIEITPKTLAKNVTGYLEMKTRDYCENRNKASADSVADVMKYVVETGMEIDLWKIQNLVYSEYTALKDPSHSGHKEAVANKELKKILEAFKFSPVVP
ncbi:MAG: DUF3536 domain-containing protein [Nitrospinae bacterium]|nr:DUF3536 domain-containing protein [Nitrospinota bacterium]